METGTYLGDGAARLREVFTEVFTIESSPELAELATERFRRDPSIHVVYGDSPQLLSTLVGAEPTFYFLDAHWIGKSSRPGAECPVLAELAALAPALLNDCVVIDDARFFEHPAPPPHDPAHWPSMAEVLEVARSTFPQHHIRVVRDQVVVVPERARELIEPPGFLLRLAQRARRSGGRARFRDR